MADNINPAKTNEFAPRKKGCKVLLSTFYVLSRDRTLKTAYRKVSKGIGSNPTNSPSGDGNTFLIFLHFLFLPSLKSVQPYQFPRQGTETVFSNCSCMLNLSALSNPTNSPVRGRKRSVGTCIRASVYYFYVQPYQFPRQGTETPLFVEAVHQYFKSTSPTLPIPPSGDGNP
ncbi:hypothetical protein AmaxDRAFT_5450 [Limnospira maxima CS-328]|uniref:Uncharacterized protein n=1 Tax=Limnospira maxima CS-328 TaxID=513049 RepID=B5W9K0_LIMMA|nr:hypothetical protein AmaxDRAFT_5450 [Limnospira maxima CS-328]